MNFNERVRDMAIEQAKALPEIEAEKISIKEKQFINGYWIDLLVSYIRGETVPITLWYTHISKSPYNPVDILDDETGDVLFTIPALIDNTKELYTDDVALKIGDVVNEAISKNSIVPNSGDNLLIKNLIDTMAPPSSRAATLQKWQPFMTRYKIKQDKDGDALDPAESAAIANYDDNDDYDDDF